MSYTITPDEVTSRLEGAPVYEKVVTVQARRAVPGEQIVTRVSSLSVETSRTAVQGDWVVTNPGGEQYVMGGDTFSERYRPVSEGEYQAMGKVRAIPNPLQRPISMDVAWGRQERTADCVIAVRVESPDRPYIIGGKEFAQTYRRLPDAGRARQSTPSHQWAEAQNPRTPGALPGPGSRVDDAVTCSPGSRSPAR